jgi:hypothetical protein
MMQSLLDSNTPVPRSSGFPWGWTLVVLALLAVGLACGYYVGQSSPAKQAADLRIELNNAKATIATIQGQNDNLRTMVENCKTDLAKATKPPAKNKKRR